jgi:hypothetical protein
MSSVRAKRHMREKIVGAICLVVSGAGIGWLMGPSMSPVLHIVVAGLLTLIAGAVAALTGLNGTAGPEAMEESPPKKPEDSAPSAPPAKLQNRFEPRRVTAVPLACFIVGIVLGSSLGIYGRTQDWLGADPKALVTKWQITKLPDDQIAKRLFDQLYPPVALSGGKSKGSEQGDKNAEAASSPQVAARLAGGLFGSVAPDEYKEFRSAPDKDLRRLMQASKNVRVRNFAGRCGDALCLRAAVEELLWPEQP